MDSESLIQEATIQRLFAKNQRLSEGVSLAVDGTSQRLNAMEEAESSEMPTWFPSVSAEDEAKKARKVSWASAFSWMAPKADGEKRDAKSEKVEISPREFCWLAHNCG